MRDLFRSTGDGSGGAFVNPHGCGRLARAAERYSQSGARSLRISL
jgi:hypothetical protein